MARRYDIIRNISINEIHFTVIDTITHEITQRSVLYYGSNRTYEAMKSYVENELFYDEALVSIDSIVRITGTYGMSRRDYILHSTPLTNPVCEELTGIIPNTHTDPTEPAQPQETT